MPIAPLRKKYIGEVLLTKGVITREQLKAALDEQQKTRERLGTILLRLGFIREKDLLEALSFQLGIALVYLKETKVDETLLKLIPERMARKFSCIPVSRKGDLLILAMADPANVVAMDEIESNTGLKVSPLLALEKDITEGIDKYYKGLAIMKDLPEEAVEEITASDIEKGEEGEFEAEDAPVIKYVNSLLFEAVTKNASDIHIEPQEDGVSLRLRLDGNLQDFPNPPRRLFSAIISRIKIMANLDIAEKRIPQDGKTKVKVGDKKIDIRVSTLRTIYGEKIVMRILDRSSVSLDLSDLGFSEPDAFSYKEALEKPYGMILVTGPTGSGKTTTLYAGLNYINRPDVNIVTVEDPVEYELRKVNQVQVRSDIGLGFAKMLRTIVRQDPDIIMVGEIRDRETAEIAIQAALTGHLVL
ncbi:MAG TPA: ATPase, T2SS/T4P/T4SS family, partial [bacterium]|nr:ATPase, T2SS/T4P/T4SS family [bacterium]